MAGQETRMLLLGAVALFEPVNGYQFRRELLSWQVDRWAHTNPGSIYHGLTSLTGQGFLDRHDLLDAGREVAVYELTDGGRAELRRLMIEALETVNPYERTGFTVAFSMLPLLDRSPSSPTPSPASRHRTRRAACCCGSTSPSPSSRGCARRSRTSRAAPSPSPRATTAGPRPTTIRGGRCLPSGRSTARFSAGDRRSGSFPGSPGKLPLLGR